jgi:hypothetical protein
MIAQAQNRASANLCIFGKIYGGEQSTPFKWADVVLRSGGGEGFFA